MNSILCRGLNSCLQMPCGKFLETELCSLAIDPGMLSSWYPYRCGVMYVSFFSYVYFHMV